MRDAFHDDLDSIRHMLVEMGEMVERSMARATSALLNADLSLAEQVISEDTHIDNVQHDLDDGSHQTTVQT